MEATNIKVKNNFIYIVLLFFITTLSFSKIAVSGNLKSNNKSILMQANEIIYQKKTDIIKAIGNVELSRGHRVI